jgi:hypothetical protein
MTKNYNYVYFTWDYCRNSALGSLAPKSYDINRTTIMSKPLEEVFSYFYDIIF